MGGGRSKLTAQAQAIIEQIMKANPSYESEVQEYIFSHVSPTHAVTASTSAAHFPESRLKARLIADFITQGGKHTAEYQKLLRQYATFHQLSVTPAELETALLEGVDDHIKAYKQRVAAEAANSDRHAAKEAELQNELRETWAGLDFSLG
jgi:hypothetical protein